MSKIFLLGPTFFGYRDMVGDEFRRNGHDVTCMDDRPSESVTFRSLGRMSYRLVDSKIAAYAKEVERTLAEGKFDYLVYLSGMSFCFTRAEFEHIRSASSARFVAGLWDAFSNCQRLGACRDLFDDIFSFEPRDCKQYGLKFRPLFYSDAYTQIPTEPEHGFDYDACFVGSVHQRSKFHAILRTCRDLEERGLRVFTWFYMPSSSVEAFRKVQDAAYRGIEFQHTALSPEQVADIYTRSRAVIDSPQAGQSGLTIRTLETLGARRKLITANPDVRNYDFYSFGDVAVAKPDGSFTNLGNEYFLRPYHDLPSDIYRSYSLHAFASALIGEGPAYDGYHRGEA